MTIRHEKGQKIGESGIAYVSESDKRGGRKRRAVFLCFCGKEFDCIIESIKKGNTKSCGCETIKMRSISNSTHGMSSEKSYEMWMNMKDRCYNEKNKRYDRYGGRGISVCDEWIGSFESFEEWLSGSGYKDGLQIDRIDNNKGYYPENCRMTTPQVNSRNRGARRDNSQGISGVTIDNKSGRYRARISLDDKSRKSIGFFSDFFEACCARKSAENRYWIK